jgi:hypothetical protein
MRSTRDIITVRSIRTQSQGYTKPEMGQHPKQSNSDMISQYLI